MYACVYAVMQLCMHIYMSVCMDLCMYVFMNAYVYDFNVLKFKACKTLSEQVNKTLFPIKSLIRRYNILVIRKLRLYFLMVVKYGVILAAEISKLFIL